MWKERKKEPREERREEAKCLQERSVTVCQCVIHVFCTDRSLIKLPSRGHEDSLKALMSMKIVWISVVALGLWLVVVVGVT